MTCVNTTSAGAVDRQFVNIDWAPLGPPQIHHDGEKFYLLQAMIK